MEEYFVEMDDDVATDNVCQHLSHYGKLKTVIIDKLVAGALTNLLPENVDDDYRKHMGSQLLLILGHLELGYSRHETDFYRAWWQDFKKGNGRGEIDQDNKFHWYGIEFNTQKLFLWAREHLKESATDKVPSLIQRLYIEIPITKEHIKALVRDLLARAESSHEFVRIWWKLVSCRSADLPWLVDELDQNTWDKKDLKKDLFRSAKYHRNLNMITRGKPTGTIGLTFAKLVRIGFVFTTEIKITLSDRLTSDTDPAECIKALNALQEHRALELETFKAWEDIVRTRFGQEIFKTVKKSLNIDQELVCKEKISRSKHDAILLLRAIQAEDPHWRDRVQQWLAEAKEDYRKGFEKIYEEWISIRENNRKTEPDQVGTIDILFQDPLKGRWQFLTRKSRGPYHPEICFAEIKSWLKSHGGWNLRGDECWQIRDEDVPVDRNELRNPRDGERFVVLLQEVPEDTKERAEATIQKFIAVTRWRRIKSKYLKISYVEEEILPTDPLLYQSDKPSRKSMPDTVPDLNREIII
jgi:hypothetical protein